MSTADMSQMKHREGGDWKARVQRFGGYLAGMIMPNISAFIAWGLITALFIETGWFPVAQLGGFGENADGVAYVGLVGPMISYLLPILIGYTGGRMVHGQRGAVVGAIATVGVAVGAGSPMFIGAMIFGPLTAYLLKLWDRAVQDKVPSGFEMLVDNFSAGIIGGAMAVLGGLVAGPVFRVGVDAAGDAVGWLVEHNLIPLLSLVVEPAKILFLNNAINQGVFTPLGAAESAEAGKSILFMIESNPGPGLGLLLAFFLFGPKAVRPSVPGAMIIHFLGGIHEIYFPYVLMRPILVIAMIIGGGSGVLTASLLNAGLVASPSPGSIFAYLAVTPKGVDNYLAVFASIAVATIVTFVVASLLMGFGRKKDVADEGAAAAAANPAAVAEGAEAAAPTAGAAGAADASTTSAPRA